MGLQTVKSRRYLAAWAVVALFSFLTIGGANSYWQSREQNGAAPAGPTCLSNVTASYDLLATDVTVSNLDLTATHANTNNNAGVRSQSFQTAGKFYFEVAVGTSTGANDAIGILKDVGTFTNFVTNGTNSVTVYRASGNIFANDVDSTKTLGSLATGTVATFHFAIDFTARKIWVRRHNAGGATTDWNGDATADPATGVAGVAMAAAGQFSPAVGFGGTGTATNDNFTLNTGQTIYDAAPPTGFGCWPQATSGVACANSGHAAAFLTRASGASLDATHISAYTALLNSLDSFALSCRLDFLHTYGTQNATAAVLNLINSSYTATVNGSPTFTTDRGYTGVTASTTVYIDTNFNPATATTPWYIKDAASASFWALNNTFQNFAAFGAFTAGGTGTYLSPRLIDGNAYFRINAQAIAGVTNANSTGHYFANRNNANSQQGYINGSNVQTDGTAALSVNNGNFYAIAGNLAGTPAGSPWQLSMSHAGGPMSPADELNFYNSLRTFGTTLGWP
jgi:hypothetical protein